VITSRNCDSLLGGKDNFEVDREAARVISAKIGEMPERAAWENRRFLWRAVDYLSRECGIPQFITAPGHPRHVPGNLAPGEIVAAFRDRVAPGSYLVITHATYEGAASEEIALMEKIYEGTTSPAVFRSHDEIEEMFAGWHPIPPGIVRPWQWPDEDSLSPRTPYLYAGIVTKGNDTARQPLPPSRTP
jgi:S-adenosyl methyltransferase